MCNDCILSIIIHIFAPCSPFVGLVEKISGVVSLAPDIFWFFSELFPTNIWWFQRNTLYLQHPKKLSKNDNDFIKEIIFARYGVESGNAPMLFDKA